MQWFVCTLSQAVTASVPFAGRGKLTALKRLKSDKTHQEIFSQLVPTELFEGLQQITCQMYFPSSRTKEVNKLRFQLLCSKRGEVESSQLPPCED